MTWGIVLLFILLWSPFIHSRTYSTNDASRMASIESLVHRQTWQIDDSPFAHTLDKIQVGDAFYSTKPPIFSFVGAGVYALLYHGLGWELQTQGCAPDLSETSCRALLELKTADWAYFTLTFLLVALPGIVMLALAYRLAWRSDRQAVYRAEFSHLQDQFCFNMKILALHSITRCPLCQIISSTILMPRYMMYAKFIETKFDHI